MKVDRCLKLKLCVDDIIPKGAWLKSRSGDWHLVLNKKGKGYTQATTGMSVQSQNYEQAEERLYIFDGHFTELRDIKEVYKMYDEMYYPNYTGVQLQLLEFIKR